MICVPKVRSLRSRIRRSLARYARAISCSWQFPHREWKVCLGHRATDAAEILSLLVRITLIVVRCDELILAAREKFHEVVEKLSRLGEPPVLLELQQRQVAPQENPVVDIVDRFESGLTSCSNA